MLSSANNSGGKKKILELSAHEKSIIDVVKMVINKIANAKIHEDIEFELQILSPLFCSKGGGRITTTINGKRCSTCNTFHKIPSISGTYFKSGLINNVKFSAGNASKLLSLFTSIIEQPPLKWKDKINSYIQESYCPKLPKFRTKFRFSDIEAMYILIKMNVDLEKTPDSWKKELLCSFDYNYKPNKNPIINNKLNNLDNILISNKGLNNIVIHLPNGICIPYSNNSDDDNNNNNNINAVSTINNKLGSEFKPNTYLNTTITTTIDDNNGTYSFNNCGDECVFKSYCIISGNMLIACTDKKIYYTDIRDKNNVNLHSSNNDSMFKFKYIAHYKNVMKILSFGPFIVICTYNIICITIFDGEILNEVYRLNRAKTNRIIDVAILNNDIYVLDNETISKYESFLNINNDNIASVSHGDNISIDNYSRLNVFSKNNTVYYCIINKNNRSSFINIFSNAANDINTNNDTISHNNIYKYQFDYYTPLDITSNNQGDLYYLLRLDSKHNLINKIIPITFDKLDKCILKPFLNEFTNVSTIEPTFKSILSNFNNDIISDIYNKSNCDVNNKIYHPIKEKWIGYIPQSMYNRTNNGSYLSRNNKEFNIDCIFEKIAFDLYSEFGKNIFIVPQTFLSYQDQVNKSDNEKEEYLLKNRNVNKSSNYPLLRVMSNITHIINNGEYNLNRDDDDNDKEYTNFKDIKTLLHNKPISLLDYIIECNSIPDKILIPNQDNSYKHVVPFHGLMTLISVARCIGDIDLLGNNGSNIAFKWNYICTDNTEYNNNNNNNNNNVSSATVLLIKPGYPFNVTISSKRYNFNDNIADINMINTVTDNRLLNTLNNLGSFKFFLGDTKDIQVSTGNINAIIKWENLSIYQKNEFLHSMHNIQRYINISLGGVLDYLFERNNIFDRIYQQQNNIHIDIESKIYTTDDHLSGNSINLHLNKLKIDVCSWIKKQIEIYNVPLKKFKNRYHNIIMTSYYIDKYMSTKYSSYSNYCYYNNGNSDINGNIPIKDDNLDINNFHKHDDINISMDIREIFNDNSNDNDEHNGDRKNKKILIIQDKERDSDICKRIVKGWIDNLLYWDGMFKMVYIIPLSKINYRDCNFKSNLFTYNEDDSKNEFIRSISIILSNDMFNNSSQAQNIYNYMLKYPKNILLIFDEYELLESTKRSFLNTFIDSIDFYCLVMFSIIERDNIPGNNDDDDIFTSSSSLHVDNILSSIKREIKLPSNIIINNNNNDDSNNRESETSLGNSNLNINIDDKENGNSECVSINGEIDKLIEDIRSHKAGNFICDFIPQIFCNAPGRSDKARVKPSLIKSRKCSCHSIKNTLPLITVYVRNDKIIVPSSKFKDFKNRIFNIYNEEGNDWDEKIKTFVSEWCNKTQILNFSDSDINNGNGNISTMTGNSTRWELQKERIYIRNIVNSILSHKYKGTVSEELVLEHNLIMFVKKSKGRVCLRPFSSINRMCKCNDHNPKIISSITLSYNNGNNTISVSQYMFGKIKDRILRIFIEDGDTWDVKVKNFINHWCTKIDGPICIDLVEKKLREISLLIDKENNRLNNANGANYENTDKFIINDNNNNNSTHLSSSSLLGKRKLPSDINNSTLHKEPLNKKR